MAIGLRVTSTKIHSKNAESVEYALPCEIEHYSGEMQLEIFLELVTPCELRENFANFVVKSTRNFKFVTRNLLERMSLLPS